MCTLKSKYFFMSVTLHVPTLKAMGFILMGILYAKPALNFVEPLHISFEFDGRY